MGMVADTDPFRVGERVFERPPMPVAVADA
jgi:hypothetical protein